MKKSSANCNDIQLYREVEYYTLTIYPKYGAPLCINSDFVNPTEGMNPPSFMKEFLADFEGEKPLLKITTDKSKWSIRSSDISRVNITKIETKVHVTGGCYIGH